MKELCKFNAEADFNACQEGPKFVIKVSTNSADAEYRGNVSDAAQIRNWLNEFIRSRLESQPAEPGEE